MNSSSNFNNAAGLNEAAIDPQSWSSGLMTPPVEAGANAQ